MLDVVISLLPCALTGCIFFGWQALLIILMSVFACVATEFIYFFIANKGFNNKCRDAKAVCMRWLKQFDLTSVVTGLILALIIPVTDKWYQVFYEVIFGAVFAIALVKMLFGGTGKNLVNPAAAARVFMFLSFSLTAYTVCNISPIFASEIALKEGSDILTGATNLTGILQGEGFTQPTNLIHPLDLFLGTGVPGAIGETCKAAILLGYIYLVARKVIKWWQPVLFIALFGFTAVLLSGFGFESYKFDMSLFLPHILSGGVMFAAVFMFPDYVTSPKSGIAQLVFIIIAALLTAVLRYLTHIEIVSFVILIMNLIVPLIDKLIRPRPFGFKKIKKVKEEK